MNKKILFVMLLILMTSVSAIYIPTPVNPEASDLKNESSEVYSDMRSSFIDYLSGTFVRFMGEELLVQSVVTGKSLDDTIDEYGQVLDDQLEQEVNDVPSWYKAPYTIGTMTKPNLGDDGTKEASEKNLNQSLYDYLKEYHAERNMKMNNIGLMWDYIISFFQITYQMMTLAFFLFTIYVMTWVVVEIFPETLIFARDLIFENIIKRRRKT